MARTFAIPLVALALLLGACGGGSSIEGTYSCPDGTTFEMREDGTFTATEGGEVIEGTYELLEGDAIRFFVEGLNTQDGAVQNGSLVLAGVEEEPCTKQ